MTSVIGREAELAAVEAFLDGSTDGHAVLAIVGEPDVTLCASKASGTPPTQDSEVVDIFAVGAELSKRGWMLDRQGPPESLHATCTPVHAEYIDEFLADLRGSVEVVAGVRLDDRSTNYATLE